MTGTPTMTPETKQKPTLHIQLDTVSDIMIDGVSYKTALRDMLAGSERLREALQECVKEMPDRYNSQIRASDKAKEALALTSIYNGMKGKV